MAAQRIIDACMLWVWFQKLLPQNFNLQWLNGMMAVFCVFENISLFTLCFVSSTEYYPIHEKGFITWAIYQQMKMIINIYLLGKITKHPFHGTLRERRSWVYRITLWGVNTICVVMAGVVFVVHSSTCVPYLYAFYALLEYLIVATNILFNCCVLLDYPDEVFCVFTSIFPTTPIDEEDHQSK